MFGVHVCVFFFPFAFPSLLFFLPFLSFVLLFPSPSFSALVRIGSRFPWSVANSRASAGDHSARVRTRRKNGVRNDGQRCGLSSPKRKRGKPNGWACRVFGETSASDTTSARTIPRPHLMSIVQACSSDRVRGHFTRRHPIKHQHL